MESDIQMGFASKDRLVYLPSHLGTAWLALSPLICAHAAMHPFPLMHQDFNFYGAKFRASSDKSGKPITSLSARSVAIMSNNPCSGNSKSRS